MKFRAVIRGSGCMRDFLNIVTTLSKCGRDVIFNARPDSVIVAVNVDSALTGLQLWCDIDREAFFDEYSMQGLSDTHNEIILEMKSASFVRALSGISRTTSSSFVKLKLMNKNMASLCVEIEVPSSVPSRSCPISHDVPVTVVSRKEWNRYKLPRLPDFEMILGVPSVKFFKHIIETMKTSSPIIEVCTAKEGTVSFIVESTMAKISCHCRDQVVHCEGSQEELSCKIESKRLALFLTSSPFTSSRMRCSISPDHLVRFEVEVQKKVIMTCIIPSSCD